METLTDNYLEESSGGQKMAKLLAIAFLIASALTYFIYTKPTGVALAEKESQLTALQTEEQTLSASLAQLEEAGKQLELDSEIKAQKVANSIPEKLEQDNLLLEMVAIAKKNDIIFNSINFSANESDANQNEGLLVKKVGISASFEGNYGDLVNFLKAVEQNGRKIVVENINVQLVGEPIAGIERVHFSLSMSAFYRNGI